MSINFNDKKNQRRIEFYKNEKVFQIDDISVNNILVSKKESNGHKNSLKYFIGYNDNHIIRPLCIKLPQITDYFRKFNENPTMSFTVKDKQLLENYNIIWQKIEKLIKIHFESMPVYGDDDKYIKTKTKIYAKNMTTNFHNKKIPIEKAPCKCLSIIMIDSVVKTNNKYYPQTFLEECKYIPEKIKTENYVSKDLKKANQTVTLAMIPNLISIMKTNLLK